MITHESQIRVRYEETDAMGITYHGNYFTWFEVARVRLLDSIGLPYRSLNEQGYHLPVLEAYCRYLDSARFDDTVDVTAAIKEKPRMKIRIEYEALLEGRRLVTGYTLHAFVNAEGTPVRPPAVFTEALDEAFAPD